jgi:outer membrane lipoprotein-sorting protein
MRARVFGAAVVWCVFVLGCRQPEAPESIPTYPLTDASETVRLLAERARRVKTLSGEGLITLTRPSGQSVRLDAAIAMAPPDRIRIRAWKLGRAMFDLTVLPEGVWAVTPDDSKRKDDIRSAGVSAAKLAKTWSVLSGGFFESSDLKTELRGPTLTVTRSGAGEPTVVCEVDRATLTPRRYFMLDDKGATRFTFTLGRYRQFPGDVVWPTRLVADSDAGKVEIELREVEVNPELPPGAFVAPRRAEKLP